jgi:hypothetical protein
MANIFMKTENSVRKAQIATAEARCYQSTLGTILIVFLVIIVLVACVL